MIAAPPSFYEIKKGVISAFNFMMKKDKVKNLFILNISTFWKSCWIVFFINSLVSVLASYGIKSSFDVSLKFSLLPKLMLITVIDIALFSILVFYIFEKINKEDQFFGYMIPFNWIQASQAIIMLSFTVVGLFLPASIFLFIGFGLVVWVTYSLWRIGKEEIGLTGWSAAGIIILSVVTEASIGLISRYISKFFV